MTEKSMEQRRARRISIFKAVRTAVLLGSIACAVSGAQAQGSLEAIKARGQVNIGYREDAPPFSYVDARGRPPQGYSVDVCNAVVKQMTRDLGLTELRVHMVSVPIDRVIPYMRAGTLDLLCANTSDTPERRKVMSFSKPIFIDGVGVLVRRKDAISRVEEIGSGPVGAIKATTASGTLKHHPRSRAWNIVPVLNGDAGLSQLQLGWIKGFARDGVPLTVQRALLPDADDYVLLPDRLSRETVAIAMRKDDAAMQALVDKVITDAAGSGEAAAWHDRWFVQPISMGGRKIALGIPMSAELKAAMLAGK